MLAAIAAVLLATAAVAELVRRPALAFALSAAAIVALFATLFVDLFPAVMPSSTSRAFDLTAANSSSSSYTLTVMTIVAAVLLPVVLAYQAWTYWVFRRRVSPEDFDPQTRNPIDLVRGASGEGDARRERVLTWPGGPIAARGADRRLLRSTRAARTPLALAVALGLATAALLVAQAILLGHVIARAFEGGADVRDLRRRDRRSRRSGSRARPAPPASRPRGASAPRASCPSCAGASPSTCCARGRPACASGARASSSTTAVQGVDALEAYFARYLPQVVLAVLVPILDARLRASRATSPPA